MIKRVFELLLPYVVVLYLRMSDPKQNPRSPDQQEATIRETMQRRGCPWKILKVYRDDGIKGRLIRRRPGLQKMLLEIKAGLIKPDLIVVDTFERFGRAEEFERIRDDLLKQHGVLIVCADNSFADPTGIGGKALRMVESIRATEANRIKAHDVIRGKKDTVRLKRWPGGPRPFGYLLEPHVDQSGPYPRMYSVLVVKPEEADVLRKIFALAADKGWRGWRLAKIFNQDPAIPDKFKPLQPSTIDYWLSNSMYVGVHVWNEHCCDIIDDARVIEANPEEEVLRQEGFCEPIIDLETFNKVKAVIEARGAKWAARSAAKAGSEGGKLIEPMAGGISVSYEFSGICRCSECGGSMVARPSGRKSKGGMIYTYYCCPRYLAGACSNKHHVRIEDLRPAIFSRLRARLFPLSEDKSTVPPWFPGLVQRVEAALDRRTAAQPDRLAGLRRQIEELDEQMAGWMQSLSNRTLPQSVRSNIELQYEQAMAAKALKEQELEHDAALGEHLGKVLDPALVIARLKNLDKVLATANTTLINVELARHIDRIECHADGRVIMQGTYLGVLEGAQALLSGTASTAPKEQPAPTPFARVVPRRLTQRKTFDCSAEGIAAPAPNEVGIDPGRFEGLGEDFMWEEDLTMPEKLSWAEEHAVEVWTYDREHPELPRDQLCAHFGKSRPTILKAIRIANQRVEQDPGEPPTAKSA
jgi:DNA invertase Pin-like site-specific DNA recombinase